MTAPLLLLALLLQPAPPLRVVGFRASANGGQQTIVVEATGDWGPVPVTREGGEIVALLPAVLTARLEPPPVQPPLEAIRLVREAKTLQVRIAAPSNIPFEAQRKGRELALVFGAVTEDATISPELLATYESLRPPSSSPEAADDAPFTTTESGGRADELRGIGIGPLRFQPGVMFGYARSDTTLDTPQAQEDSYFQIEPRLGANISLWDGRIRANYEPQIRMRSQFARINRASHEANGVLQIPIGSRFVLRGRHHFALSTLDTEEVDPGREYFFRLGRFRRNDTDAGLNVLIGPRLSAVFAAQRNRVDFEEETSFFEYEIRRASGGFEFLLTEATQLRLHYQHEEVPPPPNRTVAERTGRTVSLSLDGEVMPLLKASLVAGYCEIDAPLAEAAGRRFAGPVFSGTLEKEFSRGTRLILSGSRSTPLSAFENNAFYLSTSVRAALDVQLPLGFSGRAGGGYHWNAYRTVATGLDVPRRDRLYGWTAGLSRPLNRWAYLRADYGRDWRESNIPAFDSGSSTLLVQLGIGMFDTAGR